MGIEDEIKLEDILKEPSRLVIAKTFLQAVKTNGSVKRLDIENECRKTDISILNTALDDKIGTKAFTKLSVIITVIIGILMILTSTVGILNLIFGK